MAMANGQVLCPLPSPHFHPLSPTSTSGPLSAFPIFRPPRRSLFVVCNRLK